eukprot:5313376-Prymnesium_polylepis.1
MRHEFDAPSSFVPPAPLCAVGELRVRTKSTKVERFVARRPSRTRPRTARQLRARQAAVAAGFPRSREVELKSRTARTAAPGAIARPDPIAW